MAIWDRQHREPTEFRRRVTGDDSVDQERLECSGSFRLASQDQKDRSPFRLLDSAFPGPPAPPFFTFLTFSAFLNFWTAFPIQGRLEASRTPSSHPLHRKGKGVPRRGSQRGVPRVPGRVPRSTISSGTPGCRPAIPATRQPAALATPGYSPCPGSSRRAHGLMRSGEVTTLWAQFL